MKKEGYSRSDFRTRMKHIAKSKHSAEGSTFNKLIILILVAAVVAVVGVAAWKLDILGYLRNLAGFNQTDVNYDLIVIGKIAHYTLGDVKVLLDDGEGRCIVLGYADESKPIDKDFYGLHKKELIFKNPELGWKPIENKVATDSMAWKRELKDKMTLAVNNMKFEYNGKDVEVDLDYEDGLRARVEGTDYGWNGTFYRIENSKEIEIKKPDEKQSEIKNLIINSAKKELEFGGARNLKLDLNLAAGKTVLVFPKVLGGYVYGIRKKLNSEEIALVAKSEKDYNSNHEKEWGVINKEYLYDDSLWEGMLYKKKIKEDLFKICSSK